MARRTAEHAGHKGLLGDRLHHLKLCRSHPGSFSGFPWAGERTSIYGLRV